jgi:hypothetical protein
MDELNNKLDIICKEIADYRKIQNMIGIINADWSDIEQKISILENEQYQLNTELNIFKNSQLPVKLTMDSNNINHPDNYELITEKWTIKCKTCQNIGKDEYLHHVSTCKWKGTVNILHIINISLFPV